VIITKGEVENAMLITLGHSKVKQLARAMAKSIIVVANTLYNATGNILAGDLANTINKRLRAEGKLPLSPKESICAASFFLITWKIYQL